MKRSLPLLLAAATLGGCKTDYRDMSLELAREEVRDMRPPIVELQRSFYDRDTNRPRLETSYRVFPGGRKLRHGPERAWYADGSLQWEREYADGEPAGRWRAWFPDGTPESETFPDPRPGAYGDEPRTASWWYPNGQLSSRGPTVRGAREGLWTSWYEDGTRRSEGRWVGGRKEGEWTLWHPDGRVAARGAYRADVRVGDWIGNPD